MKIKTIALTVGVAVLFTLFIVFLIDAIYEVPKYENYCSQSYYPPQPMNVGIINCTSTYNETLTTKCYKEKGEVRSKVDANGCETESYCDYCSKSLNEDMNKYNKNIFYISALVGIIAILVGLYLPKTIDAIASGFIFGGILILLQGTIRVFAFSELNKFVKVIILGIELILLVYLGYKQLKE